MSKTMVMSPIVAALLKSEDILGEGRKWNAANDDQVSFLTKFFPKRDELKAFSENELRSWASRQASELNRILEQERFDIRLAEFQRNEFGVVSILDVLVEWLARGEKTQLHADGKVYPAVAMESVVEAEGRIKYPFGVYYSDTYPHPVAVLYTKSGDKVFMTIADDLYRDFSLIFRIDRIRGSELRSTRQRYDSLIFPMVDLNHQVDISWLKGMRAIDDNSGQETHISQALQQTKFKMNETGARVRSAVAMVLRTMSMTLPPLVIDEPFLLWIERSGMSIPIMYAYIDEENWKDPGNLNM